MDGCFTVLYFHRQAYRKAGLEQHIVSLKTSASDLSQTTGSSSFADGLTPDLLHEHGETHRVLKPKNGRHAPRMMLQEKLICIAYEVYTTEKVFTGDWAVST